MALMKAKHARPETLEGPTPGSFRAVLEAQNTTERKDHTFCMVLRPSTRGIPEILFCRILVFMWSSWALSTPFTWDEHGFQFRLSTS